MGSLATTAMIDDDDDDGRARSNAAGTPTNAIGDFHLVPLPLTNPNNRIRTFPAAPSRLLPTPPLPRPLLHLHRLPPLLAGPLLLPVRLAAIVRDRAHDAVVQRPQGHVVVRRRPVLAQLENDHAMEALAVEPRGEALSVGLVIVAGPVPLMNLAPIDGVLVRQAAPPSRLNTLADTSESIPNSIPQSTPSPDDSIPHHDRNY